MNGGRRGVNGSPENDRQRTLYCLISQEKVHSFFISGFCSILERKLLALCHYRVGPGLLLFWILLPLLDGCKLFFKFVTHTFNMNLHMLLCICIFSVLSSYMIWCIFPLGLCILVDINFSFLYINFLHVMFDVCVIFVLCIFLISCFVYLSCLRYVLFGRRTEFAGHESERKAPREKGNREFEVAPEMKVKEIGG